MKPVIDLMEDLLAYYDERIADLEYRSYLSLFADGSQVELESLYHCRDAVNALYNTVKGVTA